jgi:hypothetical protein
LFLALLARPMRLDEDLFKRGTPRRAGVVCVPVAPNLWAATATRADLKKLSLLSSLLFFPLLLPSYCFFFLFFSVCLLE